MQHEEGTVMIRSQPPAELAGIDVTGGAGGSGSAKVQAVTEAVTVLITSSGPTDAVYENPADDPAACR
jgi:hypothetical protein